MSLEQMRPALQALSALADEAVHISVGTPNADVDAWAEFSGTLGQPEFDGGRVWFPVYNEFSTRVGERSGFSIEANHFEWWGEQQGRVRLHAGGLGILVRPA